MNSAGGPTPNSARVERCARGPNPACPTALCGDALRDVWRAHSGGPGALLRRAPDLTLHQRLDGVVDLVFVTGAEALVHVAYEPVLVDDEQRGHAVDAVALGEGFVAVPGDGKADARLLDEAVDAVVLVVLRNADDRQILAVAGGELLIVRERNPARIAPGRPEIHQYHAPGVRAQARGIAFASGETEVGRWFAAQRVIRDR